jgi:hypothetical protein
VWLVESERTGFRVEALGVMTVFDEKQEANEGNRNIAFFILKKL